MTTFDISTKFTLFWGHQRKSQGSKWVKTCAKIFEQGFKIIYDSSGCHFTDIEKILKRFVNCFCKGYAKEKTDQIKQKDKITHTERKKRKFRSR